MPKIGHPDNVMPDTPADDPLDDSPAGDGGVQDSLMMLAALRAGFITLAKYMNPTKAKEDNPADVFDFHMGEMLGGGEDSDVASSK